MYKTINDLGISVTNTVNSVKIATCKGSPVGMETSK